jgi:hypothetical protein
MIMSDPKTHCRPNDNGHSHDHNPSDHPAKFKAPKPCIVNFKTVTRSDVPDKPRRNDLGDAQQRNKGNKKESHKHLFPPEINQRRTDMDRI